MDKLRKQYRSETGGDVKETHLMEQITISYTDEYVSWLEQKLALTIPVVVRQSEQLFCGVKGGFCMYEESDNKCRAEHKCINQITK